MKILGPVSEKSTRMTVLQGEESTYVISLPCDLHLLGSHLAQDPNGDAGCEQSVLEPIVAKSDI